MRFRVAMCTFAGIFVAVRTIKLRKITAKSDALETAKALKSYIPGSPVWYRSLGGFLQKGSRSLLSSKGSRALSFFGPSFITRDVGRSPI